MNESSVLTFSAQTFTVFMTLKGQSLGGGRLLEGGRLFFQPRPEGGRLLEGAIIRGWAIIRRNTVFVRPSFIVLMVADCIRFL